MIIIEFFKNLACLVWTAFKTILKGIGILLAVAILMACLKSCTKSETKNSESAITESQITTMEGSEGVGQIWEC